MYGRQHINLKWADLVPLLYVLLAVDDYNYSVHTTVLALNCTQTDLDKVFTFVLRFFGLILRESYIVFYYVYLLKWLGINKSCEYDSS